MLSFRSFLREAEQKMRQGLPHFRDLKPDQLHSLISSGKISGDVTEKTDGLAFGFGRDKEGFYTRSAKSDKVRTPGAYTAYTKQKYGEDHESPYAGHYDKIHELLQNNHKLQNHLLNRHQQSGGEDISMKGEMFYKPLGELTDKGVKFVGTSYNPTTMGKFGKFVLHSRLPENASHDIEKSKELGDENINFDHDKVENGRTEVDAKDELNAFNSLDREKMASRKKADAEAKEQEKAKFQGIKDSLESKLRSVTGSLKPKFGQETEGHVVHPDNPEAPRFKLTSDSFAEFKRKQKEEKSNA